MKTNFFSILAMASTALFLFTSCSDQDDVISEYGQLKIQLTDAPFPHDMVAEANVHIFKVDARHKGEVTMEDATIDDETMTEEVESKAFVVLMEDEIQVNLLDLTNGVTKTLVETNVPVGTYDLVRVHVKGINVVLTNGTTYDLMVPSGSQTGIKIFIKPGLIVNGGLSSDLLLDIDVSKSFVAKGDAENISGFNFKPVIKASNMSTAGTLTGRITTTEEDAIIGIEGAQVAVFVADTLNTTTFSGFDGGYMIMGLDAASYSVEVQKDGYIMQTLEDVEITAANKTVQNVELVKEE